MRTFDAKGRLLGDSTLTPDFQSMVDAAAPIVDTNQPDLPAITVTAAPVSFSWAQLFQPPYIYLLAGAALFLAFTYSKKPRRS